VILIIKQGNEVKSTESGRRFQRLILCHADHFDAPARSLWRVPRSGTNTYEHGRQPVYITADS